MNEDGFLYDFRQAPRERFADELYRKIDSKAQPAFSFPRFIAPGIALAVVLVGLMLVFSPPARAFAQNLIQQIGWLLISDEPTYAEQYETKLRTATGVEEQVLTPVAVEWQAPGILSMEEAEDLAGFTVSEIAEIPRDFNLIIRTVTVPDELNPFTAVVTTYQSIGATLTLKQLSYSSGSGEQTLPVGDSPVSEVTVQDSRGFWIEKLRLSTFVDENNQVAPAYANLLVWEKDGFQFWLQSTPGMPLEQMLKIANSIQP